MDDLDEEYTALALEAKEWIEHVSGKKFPEGSDFIDELSNGQMLCRVMRVLLPGCIKKINKSKMPFARRENISAYLKAARAFGQIEFELFDTEDLAGKKNIKSVISSLHSLGRTTQEKRPELLRTLSIKVVRGEARSDVVEKWTEEKDPSGRAFYVCKELGLSCWNKPSTAHLDILNLEHWVEMTNPDGRRYIKHIKTGETKWEDDSSLQLNLAHVDTVAGAGAGAGAGAASTPAGEPAAAGGSDGANDAAAGDTDAAADTPAASADAAEDVAVSGADASNEVAASG